MALDLTREQKVTGARNFAQASADLTRAAKDDGATRRTFLKSAAAAGAVVPISGMVYFGYEALKGGKPVRTAIIGCGDEGGVLVGNHNPEFNQIVAACDLRPYNLERIFDGEGTYEGGKPVWDKKHVRTGLTAKYGPKARDEIKTFHTVDELLAKKDELKLEAVIIATPLFTHAPIAIQCMEAGLHVLCEKLMARTIGECKDMIKKAKEKGLVLSIGHQRHYSMLYAHANEVVQSGILGDIKHIRALWHRNNSWPYAPKKGEPDVVKGTEPFYKDGWCPAIYKMDKEAENLTPEKLSQLGYDSIEQLVRWRLYNKTGGGLMAELGSHQLDASSIFLGKVKPLSVQGVGGKFFYGTDPDGRNRNDRESDDGVFVTYEFPGPKHPQAMKGGTDKNDIVVVTYSSFNTNGFEAYGEHLMGSRGSMITESEAEVYLFKEAGGTGAGGKGTEIQVGKAADGKPVVEAASTAPGGGPAVVKEASAGPVSKGYREEMEHFAFCVRKQQEAKMAGAELYKKGPDGKFVHADVLPRCHGEIAMADAILALTGNMAMKKGERIKYDMAWFDADNAAVPETLHGKG